MTAVYALNPAHLIILASPVNHLRLDEARPWERLLLEQASPHPLQVAWEHCPPFSRRRRAWISLRRSQVRGLLASRPRSRPSACEVDSLMVMDGEAETAVRLLRAACQDLALDGVQRLFLRLAADSPLLSAVCRAGLVPYRRDYLFRLERRSEDSEALPGLRPATTADLHAIYALYSSVVPASIRYLEGVTLREWQAAQERWARPRDLLLARDGRALAWLHMAAQDGFALLSLLLHPEAQEQVASLLDEALAHLPGESPAFCLVPSYQPHLLTALEQRGASPIREYVTLASYLLRPVPRAVPEPERIEGAIPVS